MAQVVMSDMTVLLQSDYESGWQLVRSQQPQPPSITKAELDIKMLLG